MTPFHSGLITFASAVGAIVMKFVAPPMLRTLGFRRTLLVDRRDRRPPSWRCPALFTPATPIALMTGLLLIGGFFRSLQFTSINALTYADVPPQRMSSATTLTSVAQQISLSVGVSLGAVVLEPLDALDRRRDHRRHLLAGVRGRRAGDAVVAAVVHAASRPTPASEMSGHGRPRARTRSPRCASAS